MSKINYSDMSKKVQDVPVHTTPAVVTDPEYMGMQVTPETETESEVNTTETQDTQQEPKVQSKVFGTVCACIKLNVRKLPNRDSEVVHIIDAGDEVTVDLDNSTDDWYKVQISGTCDVLQGYCMKKYITVEK